MRLRVHALVEDLEELADGRTHIRGLYLGQHRLTVQRKIVSTLRAMWISKSPYRDELSH